MKTVLLFFMLAYCQLAFGQLDIVKRNVSVTANFHVRGDTVPNMTEVNAAILGAAIDTTNIVYKSTTDTITGNKTFSNGIVITRIANGLVSNTTGNNITATTTDDDAIVFQGTTDGTGAHVALFTSNGDGAISIIGTATSCDTILQLNKSATNVLNVANATSSVKLNSEKDLFEFNKHIAAVEVTKAYQTLAYAASVTMNTNIGANATITLTGNCALTLSNLTNGDEGNIIVVQDATGSRTITISPTPKVINGGSGSVTLSTAANSIDIISYTYDGTNLYVNYGKNYN